MDSDADAVQTGEAGACALQLEAAAGRARSRDGVLSRDGRGGGGVCNGFVTVTCGYKFTIKYGIFLKQFQIFPMRLDELLVNANDLFSMVTHNLDAVALSRLGAVCRDIRKCSKQSEVWRACVLRTFPGIMGVPTGKESRIYEQAFRVYYLPQWIMGYIPYLELITLIGNSIQHVSLDPEVDDGTEDESMEDKICFFFELHYTELLTYGGRKNIIKCVGDWKSEIVSGVKRLNLRSDVLEMLDRMAYIAEHNFRWGDGDMLRWYY